MTQSTRIDMSVSGPGTQSYADSHSASYHLGSFCRSPHPHPFTKQAMKVWRKSTAGLPTDWRVRSSDLGQVLVLQLSSDLLNYSWWLKPWWEKGPLHSKHIHSFIFYILLISRLWFTDFDSQVSLLRWIKKNQNVTFRLILFFYSTLVIHIIHREMLWLTSHCLLLVTSRTI